MSVAEFERLIAVQEDGLLDLIYYMTQHSELLEENAILLESMRARIASEQSNNEITQTLLAVTQEFLNSIEPYPLNSA